VHVTVAPDSHVHVQLLEQLRMHPSRTLKIETKRAGHYIREHSKNRIARLKEVGWPTLLAFCGVYYLFKVPYDFAFHWNEQYEIYDYAENCFFDAIVILAMFHRFYSINEEIKSTRLPELRKASKAAIFEVAITGISSVPFEMLPSLFGVDTFVILGIRALRVLWFRRSYAAIALLYENKRLSKASFDVCSGLVVMLSWMHFGACTLFLMHRYDKDSDSVLYQCLFPICNTIAEHNKSNGPWGSRDAVQAYVISAYYVLTTFNSIGYGDLFGLHAKEKVLVIILHFGNLISYSMILVMRRLLTFCLAPIGMFFRGAGPNHVADGDGRCGSADEAQQVLRCARLHQGVELQQSARR
jgi:hypothetical protein